MTAVAEVRTDMSWCNPVPVFVSSAPSLVTGHTVTMGQHMGAGTIGDQADTDHYPGTQELCATGQLLGDSPTLKIRWRGRNWEWRKFNCPFEGGLTLMMLLFEVDFKN